VSKLCNNLSKPYAAALQRYLAHKQEQALQQAYEIGREAFAQEFGVLDMAKLHQAALTASLRPIPISNSDPRVKSAESFFLEALTPFEAAHRGFREAYLRLRELNDALEHRNLELADFNRLLRNEIAERKRTEAALRQSEKHYRELFKEARLMQEDLRHLSSQILHIQEQERTRISRELHDEVGQALTAINMSLAMLRKQTASSGNGLHKTVTNTQALLEQTMEATHRFARELRPAMLDDLGLLPALRSYLNGFRERTGIRITFQASPGAEELDGERKTVIFRVVQESLNNISKHAHASRVAVSINSLPDGFQLEIRDNGRGFSPESCAAAKKVKRLGLLGMQERVRLVKGDFALESAPGKGTLLRVQIPSNSRLQRRRSPASNFHSNRAGAGQQIM
jgi:signal transduction histidine kinase